MRLPGKKSELTEEEKAWKAFEKMIRARPFNKQKNQIIYDRHIGYWRSRFGQNSYSNDYVYVRRQGVLVRVRR